MKDEGSTPEAAPKKEPAGDTDPATAPSVPTAILRQLTGGPTSEHASSAAKSAASPSKPDRPAETEGEEPASDTDDAETDKAVDDIMAEEGDELLAAQDAKSETGEPRRRGWWRKIKDFFSAWWHNRWARWITIVILLGIISAVAAVPTLRYGTLNTIGVRASLSVVALDDTTQLPLKNVTVTAGGQQATTDINGVARLQQLRLGAQTLTIKRSAFATVMRRVVVGWGSNPLGNFSLKAVGVQYVINVTDYLSGKPLAGVEANSDGVEALSDKQGKIVLTVDNRDATAVPVAIILSGYRTEQLNLAAATIMPASVRLVTARQDVFVSKQSGNYDVYKIDVDGQNKQLLLAGTGTENQNISLVVSPAGDEAALVSTRDNMRDSDGYLLSTLTLINIASGATVTLDHAEQMQIVDWIDNRLIYEETAAGASAANSQRCRLISYDYTTSSRTQLATANQFNGVVTANGVVYYAVAAADPAAPASFNKIRPDGSARQTIYSQEVWSIFRTDYNTFTLQTPGGWYTYSTQAGNQLSKGNAPSSYASRLYDDSLDGRQSLWVDTRDGQGVLLSYDLASGKDTVLQTQAGLTYPVRWLTDNTVVYSVVTRDETADYVLSLAGDGPHKIVNVTHVYGAAQGG